MSDPTSPWPCTSAPHVAEAGAVRDSSVVTATTTSVSANVVLLLLSFVELVAERGKDRSWRAQLPLACHQP